MRPDGIWAETAGLKARCLSSLFVRIPEERRESGPSHQELERNSQRFCKEPECREIKQQIREIERDLHRALDRRGQAQLLKLADLENELQEEISLEGFLSGFKLALGIAAELAPSYSFDDEEEQRACEALQRRREK